MEGMALVLEEKDGLSKMTKTNDLVSIIMMSRNKGKYVEESIRSIQAQTYTNWELLIIDDSSSDNTITSLMELKGFDKRVKVSQSVNPRGVVLNRNSALKAARGRWIAFLDCGDLWEPMKLEYQISFMEENDYSLSYTVYGIKGENSDKKGYLVGGPNVVCYNDIWKCCWINYLTVMYDAQKIGNLLVPEKLHRTNDYALWLKALEKAECYLLDRCLAYQRTKSGRPPRYFMMPKIMWRYEIYKTVGMMSSLRACVYTIRNLWYTAYKWLHYAQKTESLVIK